MKYKINIFSDNCTGTLPFFKQKTAYEILSGLVGSEMCIRDSISITSALDNSLYELLEAKRKNPVTAKQNIHAIIADDNLADKLEVNPGSAVLFVERRGKDVNGQVVEYTQSYYRGDRYDYVVELG